ncbi:MAG: TorF family putative porin [Candidatus Reddybacter sp.]
MNKFPSTLIIIILILHSQIVYSELGGSISVVSDYRARGISQSGEKPAVQGWIEYFHQSGFYAGWWGSNVDYYRSGDPLDNKERVEHDLYLGYFKQLGENLSYDITYYEYVYTGTESDVDFSEVVLGVDFYNLRMVYWYTNDSFNTGENYSYIEADYKVSLPRGFSLTFHGGYSFGDALDLAVFGFEEYLDYSIALDKNFAGVDLSIGYSDTNIGDRFVVNDNYNANQNAVLFSVSKKF